MIRHDNHLDMELLKTMIEGLAYGIDLRETEKEKPEQVQDSVERKDLLTTAAMEDSEPEPEQEPEQPKHKFRARHPDLPAYFRRRRIRHARKAGEPYRRQVSHLCDPQTDLPLGVARRPGKLALYNLSEKERIMLAETLSTSKGSQNHRHRDWQKFNVLEQIVGHRFLEILDLLQGDGISWPFRETVIKLDRAVQIWRDYRETGMEVTDIGIKHGLHETSVLRWLFTMSAYLQILAFDEVHYGSHTMWHVSFSEQGWGAFETCQHIYQILQDDLIKRGHLNFVRRVNALVNRKLNALETSAAYTGVENIQRKTVCKKGSSTASTGESSSPSSSP